MSYLHLDKSQLINLNYSLSREYLRANRNGAYASSTLVQCNTRKYHGLLVVPQPQIDHEWHVLLSNLDETIVQKGQSFNLALRRYQHGNYSPRGHKYIADFDVEPIPKVTYRIANAVLTKEMILMHNENRILVRYTLVDCTEPTTLQLRPFMAFRGRHSLAKANTYINKKYTTCENGATWQLYENYEALSLQISKKNDFTAVPDWYYNVEYTEELERGYDFLEDLYAPGFFEIQLKKGESIVFSAGTTPTNAKALNTIFDQEVAARTPRASFENCLINAAQQFVISSPPQSPPKGEASAGSHEKETLIKVPSSGGDLGEAFIIAGFPWFGSWGRDTFLSLPGLTLATQNADLYEQVLATQIGLLKDGLFPNTAGVNNSADAPLWFFWSVQKLQEMFRLQYNDAIIWDKYGAAFRQILTAFRKGTHYNIGMHENGLIWQGADGFALTWMDAVTNGAPITPRTGHAVEINALWYNAVCYALQCAKAANDTAFANEWQDLPAHIAQNFVAVFWNDRLKYCNDFVNHDTANAAVRPNMVFATSLPFSPLSEEQKHGVLERIKSELVTPRGLRSLAPKNALYKGHYFGDQAKRDTAYHNGTVWAWLSGHFAEGYLRLYGKSGVHYIENLYKNFEGCMDEHCISTISEIFDGDPPHTPRGAISQAWSVAEVLRMGYLIETYKF
jgi:predicted glycogen debranching enzyme